MTYLLKQNGMVVDTVPNDTTSFLTIEEIVEDIIANRLNAEDKEVIVRDDYKPFLHLGLGMWIRNSYGLWLEECPHTSPSDTTHIIGGIDHNPKHPDAISALIIDQVLTQLKDITTNYDRAMQVVE